MLNDAKYHRLTLSGYTGAVDDMERDWLLSATGETEGSVNDLWPLYLSQRGFVGHINDALHAYLLSLGLTTSDHLNDLLYAFWSEQVPLP